MEEWYQLFISIDKFIVGLSLLGAVWAFCFAWATEDDDEFKYLGWRFLILAVGFGMFDDVLILFKLLPDIQNWVMIALLIIPLLLMGITLKVLHQHQENK